MAQQTYRELLAEVYEENAKSNLVYEQEFEDEDAHPYAEEDYSENELEDKDEFNKFQGPRGKPEHVIKPKPKSDPSGKTSYNIDKHIRTYALNIDGRFRSNITLTILPNVCGGSSASMLGTESAYFAFPPSRVYKNIFSIRVTSFEFYNNFYTYSAIDPSTGIGRGNTSFTLIDLGPTSATNFTPISYPILLDDGNYVIVDPILYPNVPNNLLLILQTHINTTLGSAFTDMTIGINPRSNLVFFSSVSRNFSIQFPTTTDCTTKNGIGYNFGFYNTSYTSAPNTATPPFFVILGNSIVADTFFDAVQDTYVYLRINDYDIIKHQNSDQTEFGAFMKIPLTVVKSGIQYMNSTTNTTACEYYFPQPSNISNFVFQMVDAFGKTLQMNGSTFSITMELQEVLQNDIYEKMLEL